MKLAAALLLLFAASASAAPVLNAFEFPFASFPHELWERELVWMKNVGIHTVALPVRDPASQAGLIAILRTLHKLELQAWVRLDPAAAALTPALEPFLQAHGGPVAYLNAAVPQPVTAISALSPNALAASRAAMMGNRGTLLWTDIEDSLRPEFRRGAISFLGEEAAAIGAVRRAALLFGYWQAGLANLSPARDVRSAQGPLPEGVTARQAVGINGISASAISITNAGKTPFHGNLRVAYPPAKRNISLPPLNVPAGESLWLPVNIPLAKGPFCKNCDALGNEDSVVYATVELIAAEYENGILAMEFCAPTAGEAVLHLSKEPSGPFLAAGKPRTFDWDTSSGRARLPVPAGKGPGYRVRIGLALEPPDSSAFFEEAKLLIIGQKNTIPTTYSSPEIAARSRVRAPAGLKLEPVPKGPLQIDYEVTVPPDSLHGDHLELALEADGVQMGHARLQLLRAASLRVREAVNRHFGTVADLPVYPSLVSVDQRTGRDISITVRNNFPAIQNFVLELSGTGLEFSPPKVDISVAAASERDISVRVFPSQGASGLHEARAKLSGAAAFDLPLLFAVIPRGESIGYEAGGVYILESARVRAVFADRAQRNWLEFTWKDSEHNVLPEAGVDLGPGDRKIMLKEAELFLEQAAPAPGHLKAGKQGDLVLQIQHPAPGRSVYTLSR